MSFLGLILVAILVPGGFILPLIYYITRVDNSTKFEEIENDDY